MSEPLVEFGELPPRHGRKYGPVADALRERPGEWAIIKRGVASSHAANINNGHVADLPPSEFEATARRNGEKCDIWVRYKGTDQGGPDA